MATIRLYQKEDKKAVRALAAKTAHFGESGGTIFPDTKLLGFLLTEYFLQKESKHVWVAETGGQIVGYLMATFRERHLKRTMFFRVIPVCALALLANPRSLFSKRLWRMLWFIILLTLSGQLRLNIPQDRRSGAHLHINLDPQTRGQGIGDALMSACLEHAKKVGIPSIRLRSTRMKERCAFFEKHGFTQTAAVRSTILERWFRRSPVFYMEYFRKI